MESRSLEPVTYAIDQHDRITSIGGSWEAFARANAAPELSAARVVGREIYEFIADMETIHLYEVLLEKTRETNQAIAVQFRCDAPALRRYMELLITPVAGAVRFESRLVRAEAREEMPILDATRERSNALQKICCWCKRMLVADVWLEIEDAIARLELFQHTPLPMLTHAVCADCRNALTRSLSSAS